MAIANYGVGNIHSIRKAVEKCGYLPSIAVRPASLEDADTVILPGVGSFGSGMRWFSGGTAAVKVLREKAVLGICLGEQILFDSSEESPLPGLSLMPGRVLKLEAAKVPNVGWAGVEANDSVLFDGIQDGECFYFTHSFYAMPEETSLISAVTTSSTKDGEEFFFPCAVRSGRIAGVQFHPEKSSSNGLRLLRNFLSYAEGEM